MAKNENKNQDKKDQKAEDQIDPKVAVEQLKEKIISECKDVATGKKMSIYELIEMSKELIALEAVEAAPSKDQF